MLKKAILFMIVSALAFALLNTSVKSLNHFNVYQIVFFRSIGTLLFTIPLIYRKKIPIYGNKKQLLILRGVFGVTSMILFFISIKYLAIGTAVSIRYISPIFAAVLALFFLKEKIKNLQWIYFSIAFLGVIIIKGFDVEINDIGLVLAIASAFFSGLVFITIRKINTQDHPLVIVNYFMIIAAIVGGALSVFNWVTPTGFEWVILLCLGVFGYYGQFYMTKALQSSETIKIAPLKYIEVIFTVLIGSIWLDETYTFISIIGIALVIIGLTLNIHITRRI